VQELFKPRGTSPQQILDACEDAINIQDSGDLELDAAGAQIISDLLAKLVSKNDENLTALDCPVSFSFQSMSI
jgi:hypothetical protein